MSDAASIRNAEIDPVKIAQALIRCPSITPAEGGALAYLDSILAGAGFDCHRVSFSEQDTPDVENLYARIGTEAPVLVFAGHTDVVPPGDESAWTHPPFAASIAGDQLYGRGAADMKGGIAAFAAAALRFVARHEPMKGSIAFLITGDEEGPSINGTRKLLEWAHERGERFDAAIVGEPTSRQALGDVIKIGRRGSLSGRIHVQGSQGHVAYPELANNPIPGIARLIDRLLAKPLDERTEHFQPSNLEFTSVDVDNSAFNVIPGYGTACFNIRFNDRHSAESLKRWLEKSVRDLLPAGLHARISFEPNPSDVFLTRADGLIGTMVAAITAQTGRQPELTTGGGTSDARYIKDYCPVIEFGLVGQTMHQIDEHVPVADLEALSSIYLDFLNGYLNR